MKIIISKHKRVADFCYELFRISELPIYFSKYSNKIYSNFQKLFLLIYKQFRKFTYEDLLTDIADNGIVRIIKDVTADTAMSDEEIDKLLMF